MPPFDHHFLSFLIRWAHVGSMAFLLGGAILVWGLSSKSDALDQGGHNRLLIFAAEKYEMFFWVAMGIQVITGIGNLGAFGAALPDASTAWGVKLTIKLLAVLIFFVLSLLRTFLFTRLSACLSAAGNGTISMPLSKIFQGFYGGTVLALAAILILAVYLAHG